MCISKKMGKALNYKKKGQLRRIVKVNNKEKIEVKAVK